MGLPTTSWVIPKWPRCKQVFTAQTIRPFSSLRMTYSKSALSASSWKVSTILKYDSVALSFSILRWWMTILKSNSKTHIVKNVSEAWTEGQCSRTNKAAHWWHTCVTWSLWSVSSQFEPDNTYILATNRGEMKPAKQDDLHYAVCSGETFTLILF